MFVVTVVVIIEIITYDSRYFYCHRPSIGRGMASLLHRYHYCLILITIAAFVVIISVLYSAIKNSNCCYVTVPIVVFILLNMFFL